jgi:Domain of unknown function (DUF4129)
MAAPWLAAGGPGVTRGQGQRLARSELSKAIYHPSTSLTVRIADAIQRALARFYSDVSGATPGGWWGFVALVALIALVVGLVFVRIGPIRREHKGSSARLWAGGPLTAQQRRAEAERLAGSGDFSAAIMERMRAIAAGLEERAVIMPNPGLTADELAREAGRVLPGHAAALRQAAGLFDDVCYGKRPGTRAGYERLRELDSATSNARPDLPQAGPVGLGAGR